MKIGYIPSSASQYEGLLSASPVDRRRLAVLIDHWTSQGVEVCRWRRGGSYDVVYVVSANSSLSDVEYLIRHRQSGVAVVIGLTEDVLTAEWATFDDERIDEIETITTRHFKPGLGRAAAGLTRDLLAKLRILPRAKERLLHAIRWSDYIVCCSEAQAASLRHINPFCDAIAEAIPPSDFPLQTGSLASPFEPSEGPPPIRLLWEGTEWGMQLLEPLRQPLERLASQTSIPFELVVAMPRIRSSPFFGEFDNQAILEARFGTRARFFPWHADTIGSLIRACDIGLAPMPQLNPFYRAKAFNKPAVYMSLGLPVVVSAIPSYQQLVSHGEDGFIASTPREWTTYLQTLIEQPALRSTMGAQAQAKIEYMHSVDTVAQAFLSAFQRASVVALSRM